MAATETPAKRLGDLTNPQIVQHYNAAHAAWRDARGAVEYWEDEHRTRAGHAALGIETVAAVEQAEAELAKARAALVRTDAAMRWLRGLPQVRGFR